MYTSRSRKSEQSALILSGWIRGSRSARDWVRLLVLALVTALVSSGAYVTAQAQENTPEGPAVSHSPHATDDVGESGAKPGGEIPPVVPPADPVTEVPHELPGETPVEPQLGSDAPMVSPFAKPISSDPLITVHAGGIRTGSLSVGGLPNGATFEAVAVSGSPAGGPFTCVLSSGTGTCQINVPSGYRWDVRLTSAPSGYYLNPTLDYGGSSTVAPASYSFRTAIVNSNIDVPGTDPNGTYADVRDSGNNYFSGLLASSVVNPAVSQRCGLDVALVLDQSGSMAGSKQTDLKAAAHAAVDALTGTPSQLAIYTFASSAGTKRDATSTATVSSALPLHTFINGLGTPNGYTNWDAGIYQVPSGFDLAIVLTDGAPTTWDSAPGTGGDSYFKYAEEGIFSANALKSLGTRVVGLGVGIDGSEANLRAISGTTAGSDYFLASTENFDDVLTQLATGSCNTQLTIQKQIQDPTGAVLSNSEFSNGWDFSNTISAGSIDATVTTGVVNAQNGFAAAAVSVPVGATPELSVTETLKSGYTLVSASCSINGVPVQTRFQGSTATFTGAADQPLSCIFVNKQDPGAWTLTKSADPVSGTAVNENQDVTYTLTATNDSDVAVVNAMATDDLADVLDNANLGTLPAGLARDGTSLQWDIGFIAPHSSATVTFTVTVKAGAGGQSLFNTVTPGNDGSCSTTQACETTHPVLSPAPTLSLHKSVVNRFGGQAQAIDWTLSANGPVAISGVSGDSTVTSASVEAGSYTLSESGSFSAQYQWTNLLCMLDGHPIDGVSVTQPVLSLDAGDDVTCTFTNSDLAADLTLTKIVDNNDANTNYVPSDFTLTATPIDITGQSAISGNGDPQSPSGVAGVQIFAGSYRLSETGPDGFTAGEWECAGGILDGDVLTVLNGESVECRITNLANDPILTLVKIVDNADTGGLATATDWILTADASATGGAVISGRSGDASVTTAFVPTGTYLLSEEGTIPGYTAGEWVCDNGYTGSSLVLGLDETVSCAITNTAVASSWSVHKSSDPASGSTVKPGDTIHYSVSLTHLGGVVPAQTTLTDDLSDVLDNAAWGDVQVTSGDAQLSGTTLTWTTGEVADTAVMTYDVVVSADAYNQVLRNVVTPPRGGECDQSCVTENPTPHFVVEKTSDPVSGSYVNQGDTITYTLTATNDSLGLVSGAWVTDDLSSVMDNATLGAPLAAGLSLEADGHTLRWDIPEMSTGSEPVSVSYTITVTQSSAGATLTNVAVPGDGGECLQIQPSLFQQERSNFCSTVLEVRYVNLVMTKTHTLPVDGDAVESGNGSRIDYVLSVQNVGTSTPRDDVHNATLVDDLPAGLTYDLGSISAEDWDLTGTTQTHLQATYVAHDGVFAAGSGSTITITAIVGVLPKPEGGGPFSSLVNRACVNTQDAEIDFGDNCSSTEVRVKWVGLDPVAQCVNNVPAVNYAIPVFNGIETPVVTMIWWTAEGYANRDPLIPATDTAALLADGAQAVNDIPVPPTWTNGDTITGVQLWPGAQVDAQGNPIAWPGWSQDGAGQWYLNPAAPYYLIRDTAYIEVRITSEVTSEYVIVDQVPGCNPSGLNTHTSSLSTTGANPIPWFLAAVPLVALGAGMLWWSRRRKKEA